MRAIRSSTSRRSPCRRACRLDDIMRRGQEDNEPHCLVEGVRRVVDGEVRLHFHRVVAR